ncbi:hypothetical protein AUJ67_05155 [Candidatus Desantisbacteria bacterium CG1_02_49_89]|nr:MAG: hypothetical protein AUJ67_05155 [Candidatus Desantisbacteria bacterium CG1_02_49_89]
MLKRLFDIIVSAAGILLLSPFFVITAAIIKLDSKGPVFYRGVRVGRKGKLFKIYKFRTMVADADRIGGSSTPEDDPRVTRIGGMLRKFKLDELPQLLNVLEGDMSFVGPRPEVSFYVNMFKEEEKVILNVKPGITDWASLWNSNEGAVLAGSSDPEKIYMEKIRPEKIKLQLKYIKEQSFSVDLKIIFLTLRKIVFRI